MLSKRLIKSLSCVSRTELRAFSGTTSCCLQQKDLDKNKGDTPPPSREHEEQEGVFKRAMEKAKGEYDPEYPLSSSMKATKDVAKDVAEGAKEKVKSAYESIKESVSSTSSEAQNRGESMYGKTKETVSDTANKAKEKAESMYDTAKETAKSGADKLSWEDTKETYKEKAGEIKERIQDTAESMKERMGETGHNMKEKMQQTGQSMKEGMKDSWESLKDTAKQTKEGAQDQWNTAKDKTKEVKDAASEKMSNSVDKTLKRGEKVSERVTEMYSGTKGDSKGGSGFNQITPEQTENMKGQQSASGAHGSSDTDKYSTAWTRLNDIYEGAPPEKAGEDAHHMNPKNDQDTAAHMAGRMDNESGKEGFYKDSQEHPSAVDNNIKMNKAKPEEDTLTKRPRNKSYAETVGQPPGKVATKKEEEVKGKSLGYSDPVAKELLKDVKNKTNEPIAS
ncbi:uncharacterized protein LOC136035327 isoform X5 [Artemia franciscana]|uniref:uncharacterized protein LOC136035327 isoform X5 n=1 Tax=Artemia franciscana TaxID=6661 RepID=UPI0032DB4DF6